MPQLFMTERAYLRIMYKTADDHELWISNEVCEGKLNADLFWKILDKNKSQFIDSKPDNHD